MGPGRPLRWSCAEGDGGGPLRGEEEDIQIRLRVSCDRNGRSILIELGGRDFRPSGWSRFTHRSRRKVAEIGRFGKG